jgi:hypothetical protein
MQSNETRYFEMTQRSILAGVTPTVIIKAGANVTVKGTNGGLVTAESESRWGLKVEKHSETPEDVIEVQLGASGEVSVPFDSKLKIYAGKNIDVQGIRGQVDAYSGFKLSMKDVYCLGNASAGGTMSLDCETMLGENVEFKSGSDLRFYIHDLTSAHIRVKDLGGFWEAKIGSGEKSVYLKCGGDATLVTDQQVDPLPPHYVLGKIERPALE